MKGGCSGIAVKCTLQSGGGFQVSFSGVMGLADWGTRWPFTES